MDRTTKERDVSTQKQPRKNAQLVVRMHDFERDEVSLLAVEVGMTTSDFVMRSLRVAKNLIEAGQLERFQTL